MVRDAVNDFHVRMAVFRKNTAVMRIPRSCDDVNVPSQFRNATHESMRSGSVAARVERQTVVQKVDDAIRNGGEILWDVWQRCPLEPVLVKSKQALQAGNLPNDLLGILASMSFQDLQCGVNVSEGDVGVRHVDGDGVGNGGMLENAFAPMNGKFGQRFAPFFFVHRMNKAEEDVGQFLLP